jgi:uroporphyrinogen decarboxylase
MFTSKAMTHLDRFINTMEYKGVDRVPNHEVGVWPQTADRWLKEGLDPFEVNWDWFTGDDSFGIDAREYIPVNYNMMPGFKFEYIEKNDRYEIFRDEKGIVHKALIEGMSRGGRSCMDQYLRFPVENAEDFKELKKKYIPDHNTRYPNKWKELRLNGWQNRMHPLILGQNCSTLGFYWRAREWMGTENLSYAWYDLPELMHEMMEFIADFTIAVSKPILEKIDVDYVMLNEDMSMKNGPLLSPDTYKTFIFKPMKRLVDFFKNNGVRYVVVDTDGDCDLLIPHLLDTGVDAIWPLERCSENMNPNKLRQKYGKSLRLMGGVDKREIAKGASAIDRHLKELASLVEEGGYIPTVDHTVPPDVSLENFRYYMKKKEALLSGTM